MDTYLWKSHILPCCAVKVSTIMLDIMIYHKKHIYRWTADATGTEARWGSGLGTRQQIFLISRFIKVGDDLVWHMVYSRRCLSKNRDPKKTGWYRRFWSPRKITFGFEQHFVEDEDQLIGKALYELGGENPVIYSWMSEQYIIITHLQLVGLLVVLGFTNMRRNCITLNQRWGCTSATFQRSCFSATTEKVFQTITSASVPKKLERPTNS